MTIAEGVRQSMEKSSWIRKMFEEGARLKEEFGAENVYDFSLGNPDVDPPEKFFAVLSRLASEKQKGVHGYMPNAGYPEVRQAIAEKVAREHGVSQKAEGIIMTCGAAGAMNTVLKAILNPGDEVVVSKPYFVEYNFYISNHGGVLKLAESKEDFSLDIASIEKAITEKTRAVIVNSPNNPTGRIYREEELKALGDLLKKKQGKNPIYLISDEPYREIVYDNTPVPSILKCHDQAIVMTSYSKSLSLPGERIGYIAVSDNCAGYDELMAALIMCNRILGYVNAPALMQRIVSQLTNVSVDTDVYLRRRNLLCDGLRDAGYEFPLPEGAFYVFCKAPGGDDVAWVQHLQKYNVLAVPGVGFGGPGYFRLSYCISEETIKNSLPFFAEAINSFKG